MERGGGDQFVEAGGTRSLAAAEPQRRGVADDPIGAMRIVANALLIGRRRMIAGTPFFELAWNFGFRLLE